jgi:hypothetical protein
MGVLSCSRRNCKNEMCSRYSHRYGYICNDCFEELVEFVNRNGFKILPFLRSAKADMLMSVDEIRDRLAEEFKDERGRS